MKNLNIILIMLALIGGFTACNDALNVVNPNNQTTYDFGESEAELQELSSPATTVFASKARLPVSVTQWMPYVATKCGIHPSNGIWSTTISTHRERLISVTNGYGVTGTMW